MAEVYDIFKNKDGNEQPDKARGAIALQMIRAACLINEGIKDVPSKIKTELMLKKPIYGASDSTNNVVENAADLYEKLDKAERRSVDTTLRDIMDSFWDEMKELSAEGKTISDALKILDDYIEFKTKIDTVSPETAAEVDRLANMTDEEFEAELAKDDEEDEEEEEETEQVDTPISLSDFNNLTVAELIEKYGSHDTAQCLIDAEDGEEKIKGEMDTLNLFDPEDKASLEAEYFMEEAPDTEEYNPDYDIPDEKLYPQD